MLCGSWLGLSARKTIRVRTIADEPDLAASRHLVGLFEQSFHASKHGAVIMELPVPL
jgi:hypothetical protein